MLLTCPECGAPVIDKLDSCRECGCPIDYIKHHQTTQLECPECSNIFDESLECCPACGCPNSIIELAAIKVELANNHVNISKTLNEMILLPAGEKLSPKIEELTGITNEELNLKGRSSVTVCEDFVDFVGPDKPLMISYNAQFDMSFLLAFLRKNQHEDVYDRAHTIDALTVYRDRRSYPHKLCNAIEAYNLGASVHNSHRAIDDTYSLLEVIIAMQRENSDLNRYIDLFGYLPKFGINGPSLPGIQYKAQPYNSSCNGLFTKACDLLCGKYGNTTTENSNTGGNHPREQIRGNF